MSAEISVLISTTLSKGTEVPRARSPAHSLTHSLTVHLFTHSSCSTLSGATRTRTCRCCSAAACRLVPRACPVARTSSRGLHRAALMHHFLSDACRVCLAGRYGHMPSVLGLQRCGRARSRGLTLPSPRYGAVPAHPLAHSTCSSTRPLARLTCSRTRPLIHSPTRHSPTRHSPTRHSPTRPSTTLPVSHSPTYSRPQVQALLHHLPVPAGHMPSDKTIDPATPSTPSGQMV
jgi:hypothetical protein